MEQFIVAGTAVLLFLWFLAPVLAGGKVNIGNVTGFVGTGLLFLYGIFMRQVHGFLIMAWSRRGGRIVLLGIGFVVLTVLLLAAVESFCMVKAACCRPKEPLTAVLLGCSVKGTRPCTVLRERMDAAYRYLLSNPDALCILSGGKGEEEEISEAECMYRYLTEKGIAEERLICEDQSTSTKENLKFSGKIMQERGMELKIAVITSAFHSYRAAMIAADAGFESYSVAAGTFWLYLPAYYVRELYGILHYWLFRRGQHI